MKPYVHLQNLNISKNDIRDVSTVAELPHLVNFQAAGCAIKDLDFLALNPSNLQYLQVSRLSKITAVSVARPHRQQNQRAALLAPAAADQALPL